jgi:hypothetical protein
MAIQCHPMRGYFSQLRKNLKNSCAEGEPERGSLVPHQGTLFHIFY